MSVDGGPSIFSHERNHLVVHAPVTLGERRRVRVAYCGTSGTSAMETQTMVTLGLGNYRLGRHHVRTVMVHELAHHWYCNSVSPADWREHLRRRLGDATFDRLVRSWPQGNAHTSTGRDALVAWWRAGSGQYLAPFFDRWLDSVDSPA